jgi:CRP/FNR family transcriptional regulator
LKVPAASLTQPLDKLCQVCPARPLSICANLEGSSLHRLAGMMTHREFSAHQEIIHQEETSNLVAIIISGLVKLTRLLPDGREQIVAILSRGHSIGEVYEDLSHDSVQCITDVTLCCFRKAEFERVLESEPAIEREFVSRLQHDLNDARDWLTVLGRLTAREKVASFLSYLASNEDFTETDDSNGEQLISLPLRRAEIAGFLGLTIETVSRNITHLRRMGIISMEDAQHVRIIDRQALAALGQADSAS